MRIDKRVLIACLPLLLAACGGNVDDVLEEIDPPQVEFITEEELANYLEETTTNVNQQDESPSNMNEPDEAESEPESELEETTDNVELEKDGPVADDTVNQLYLLDANGQVAPQIMRVGGQSLEGLLSYLVQGGPIEESLPSGFQAVLPPGTEIMDVTVMSGVAEINLSEEFLSYEETKETAILEALTWTATSVEGVDRIKLLVNGEEVQELPHGASVKDGYSRANGINLELTDHVDLINTDSVTLYFLQQQAGDIYYVPVTRRVDATSNKHEAIVNELLAGPEFSSPLLTDVHQDAALTDEPTLNDGTLTLTFNDALVNQADGAILSEETVNMLVLSLTENEEIDRVAIEVDGLEDPIMMSTGEVLAESISRPLVNIVE